MNLKLMKPSIDVISITLLGKAEERLVIRGVVDPTTLESIQTADYQREIIPGCKVKALMEAAKTSVLPDIELGMRGESYQVKGVGDETAFFLKDEVFVIDGLQRINALRS